MAQTRHEEQETRLRDAEKRILELEQTSAKKVYPKSVVTPDKITMEKLHNVEMKCSGQEGRLKNQTNSFERQLEEMKKASEKRFSELEETFGKEVSPKSAIATNKTTTLTGPEQVEAVEKLEEEKAELIEKLRNVEMRCLEHEGRHEVGADASSIGPVSSSLDTKTYSSLQPRKFGSRDDVKHHKDIIPPNCQGWVGDWSTFGGEIYSQGGRAKQWRVPSKPESGSDFVENDQSFIEDVVRLPDESGVSEVGKYPSADKGSESTKSCVEDNSENSQCSIPIKHFDICPPKLSSVFTVNRGWRVIGTLRGRGRQSWWKCASTSSADRISFVGADASSNGPGSSSLDRKAYSSSRSRGFDSQDDVKHHEDITPPNRQGRVGGRSTFGGESYSHGGRARQWRVSSEDGNGSDFVENGVNNQASEATVASPLNLDWSCSENISYSHEGRAKQWRVPSKAESGSDFVENGVSNQASKATVASPLNLDQSFLENVGRLPDESRVSEESEVGKCPSEDKGSESTNSCVKDNSENSQCSISIKLFDTCPPKLSSVITLKPSLLEKNREKRKESKRCVGPKGTILRPGMLLLKNYLSSSEQATVLRICRSHGIGQAGFYQPGFRDGGKLLLKMMCFGKFWDCETHKYGEFRPMDGAKPPDVPREFLVLVDRAIKDSHSLIAEDSRVRNVEDILPPVKPDICLVNYYSAAGRLGLHQDKGEGRESLRKGIPVVSFSIGDTAEFLYCDERDVEKAEKITLESGDVLIFGGKSRHVFHGVSAIVPNSAPKSLLEETNFRPGRLNLTFRQNL